METKTNGIFQMVDTFEHLKQHFISRHAHKALAGSLSSNSVLLDETLDADDYPCLSSPNFLYFEDKC